MLISLFEIYETGGPIVFASSDRRILITVNRHQFGIWVEDGPGYVEIGAIPHQLDFQCEPFANVAHDGVEVFIHHIERYKS